MGGGSALLSPGILVQTIRANETQGVKLSTLWDHSFPPMVLGLPDLRPDRKYSTIWFDHSPPCSIPNARVECPFLTIGMDVVYKSPSGFYADGSERLSIDDGLCRTSLLIDKQALVEFLRSRAPDVSEETTPFCPWEEWSQLLPTKLLGPFSEGKLCRSSAGNRILLVVPSKDNPASTTLTFHDVLPATGPCSPLLVSDESADAYPFVHRPTDNIPVRKKVGSVLHGDAHGGYYSDRNYLLYIRKEEVC